MSDYQFFIGWLVAAFVVLVLGIWRDGSKALSDDPLAVVAVFVLAWPLLLAIFIGDTLREKYPIKPGSKITTNKDDE